MESLAAMNFNYFDIVISAIVLLLGIKGFFHGFIKEMFGLIGLIGGVYFASRQADFAAKFIDQNFLHLENFALLKLIGFLTILIAIWLITTIIGSILSKLTSASGLGFINRILGFILGGGKYFLIFALIVTALSNVQLIKDNLEKHVSDSLLYPYLKQAGSYLINLDPSKIGLENNSTQAVLKNVVNINTTPSHVEDNQSTPSK